MPKNYQQTNKADSELWSITTIMEVFKDLKKDIKELSDKVILHHDENLVFQESTKNLYTTVTQNSGNILALRKTVEELTTDVKLVTQSIKTLDTNQTNLSETIKQEYVNKLELDPIKRVVYGAVSVALTALAVAIIGLVLIK